MNDLINVERLNFYRLSLVLLDVGTHTLQGLFEKEYSTTGDLQTFLNSKTRSLNKLYRRKVINHNLKELLQPSNGTKPVLESFDISLVSTLLTNICPIKKPLAGWAVPPAPKDTSTGADVLRLKTARNELYAHRVQSSMTDATFQKEWTEIVSSISRLSNQLDKKKQEHIQSTIANIETAHIDWNREYQMNKQLYNETLCDISNKLDDLWQARFKVISSDEGEDATDAEIPKGPDAIICVLKEFPKLKSDLPKDSGEAIAQHLLKTNLINRDEYDKIKDSSCSRRVCIDRLLKMVVQGKPELLECFFNELKTECPCLAIALSKRTVTQEDRNMFKQVEERFGDEGISRITVNHTIDDCDISFFENHLCGSPEVIDGINDELLSQFLISIWEHSKVTCCQVPKDMIRTLFKRMQLHQIDPESVLQDKLQPALFDSWTNFKKNKLHRAVLDTCLPIFEGELNFENVWLEICRNELLDHSSCTDISKQSTTSRKTRQLLFFIQQRERSIYNEFKECLVRSQQSQLKNVLEAEEAKRSQGSQMEENLGNQYSWRLILQWIHTAAAPLLAPFSRHFRMRYIDPENGSIILKFEAGKDFNVELLDQCEVQIRLEKLLRKGCLDSKIKVERPVYVTVYILSPGDEGREEDIHIHLDFEAFHAQKVSKEIHEIKLLVEELNPSQLEQWIFDQHEIGTDSKEKMEDIVSQRDLSRREKMEFLLDNIIKLDNGHGILEQFCEENDRYVYEKVFRNSKQMSSQGKIEMNPKASFSYQKGGGLQKLYSMWININVDTENSEADKGQTLEVQEEENIKKGSLGDEEKEMEEDYEEENEEYRLYLLKGETKMANYESLKVFQMPLCLIETQSDGKLKAHQNVLDQISQIDHLLNIVCIVGPKRTGKSYLLTRLAGRNKGFALGSSIDSKTKGIWVWCRPHPIKKDQVLLLLDTEGLDDIQEKLLQGANRQFSKELRICTITAEGRTGHIRKGCEKLSPSINSQFIAINLSSVGNGNKNNDNQILSLGILLSSTLVYNILGSFSNDDLQTLLFVTEVFKNITFSDKISIEESSSNFDRVFPTFILTLRDFILKMVFEGKQITPDEYLEKVCLKVQPNTSQKNRDNNRTRLCLMEYFKTRKCFTFDRPGGKTVLRNLEDLQDEDLQQEFVQETKLFLDYVYNKCPPKQMNNGHPVNGRIEKQKTAEAERRLEAEKRLREEQKRLREEECVRSNEAYEQLKQKYEKELQNERDHLMKVQEQRQKEMERLEKEGQLKEAERVKSAMEKVDKELDEYKNEGFFTIIGRCLAILLTKH